MHDKVHAEALGRLEDHAAAVFGRRIAIVPTYGICYQSMTIGFSIDAPEMSMADLSPGYILTPVRKGAQPSHARVDAFENGGIDDQAAILITAFEQIVVPNIEYGRLVREVIGEIPSTDLAMLEGFEATTVVCGPGYWSLTMEWQGLGHGLRKGLTHKRFSNVDKRQWSGLAPMLRQAISRQRRLQRLIERGITMEAPLFQKLRSIGADIDAFVEATVIADLKDMASAYRETVPLQTINGHKIQPGIVDGHVRGGFSITDTVSWKQGSVVIGGMTLPDTVRSACKGQPLRNIVDHPWLDGYDVSSVCQTGETVTIQTVARGDPVIVTGHATELPQAA